jgi:hypothetical protein
MMAFACVYDRKMFNFGAVTSVKKHSYFLHCHMFPELFVFDKVVFPLGGFEGDSGRL